MRYLLPIILSMLIRTGYGQTNFVRDPANPVITTTGSVVAHLADPCVIYDNGKFRMWSGSVGTDFNYASIAYSESLDGSNWSTPVIVFSPSAVPGAWDNSKTEVPYVIKDTTELDTMRRYKMWYCGADSSAPGVVDTMGLAFSHDGLTWTRVPAIESPYGQAGAVLAPGFIPGDAGVISDPSVLKNGSTYHAWYNSFGVDSLFISHATSIDGINWTKDPANPILKPTEPWEEMFHDSTLDADVVHPTVLFNGTEYQMWYGSFDSSANETYTGLGFATSPDGSTWTKHGGNPMFLPDTSKPGEEFGLFTGPHVLIQGGNYHLFYAAANDTLGINILHATSPVITALYSNQSSDFRLLPNPAQDEVQILSNIKIGEWKILTLEGKEMLMGIGEEIDVSNLRNGLYLFQTGSISKRLVISR